MKPHRVRMAHSLVLHYGLYQQMQVCVGGCVGPQCWWRQPARDKHPSKRVFSRDATAQFLTPDTGGDV